MDPECGYFKGVTSTTEMVKCVYYGLTTVPFCEHCEKRKEVVT